MRRAALVLLLGAAVGVVGSVEAKSHSRPAVGSLWNTDPSHFIPNKDAGDVKAEARAQLQALLGDSVNGSKAPSQKGCTFCTLGVSLLEQYAMDSSQTLSAAAQAWCTDLTIEVPLLLGACNNVFGPMATALEQDFANRVAPDVSCRTTLAQCTGAMTQCTLFPEWPVPAHSVAARMGVPKGASTREEHLAAHAEHVRKFLNINFLTAEHIAMKMTEMGIDTEVLEASLTDDTVRSLRSGNKVQPAPIPDWDQDKYGAAFGYRGIQFRGQDCNDGDASVYPGRNALQGDFDASADTNCNGINGTDPTTGVAWEQALCGKTPPRGILAIGDSATAHFSLPPTYMTPSGFNATTYSHLVQEILTEADWPQCSWSTGWATNGECPNSSLNVSSIYQRMFERNRCMHRDYVNAGVNGASVNNIIDDGVVTPSNYTGPLTALPARYGRDGPSTVFFSMIGNDICHAKALDAWTPVDVFQTKVGEIFAYLDSILAPNSHVVIMGLVDGRVLYDTLKDARHPAGCTYTEFYDYLNCQDMSPCWGWMNSNSTIRDASTERAMAFNQVYQQFVSANQFKNFDLHYLYVDWAKLIADWVAAGNSALDLIEPVDGFHPSQTGQMVLADLVWKWLEQEVPEALGQVNPNNDEIVQMFGDQGGYGL